MLTLCVSKIVTRTILLGTSLMVQSICLGATVAAIDPEDTGKMTSWARLKIEGQIVSGDQRRIMALLPGSIERSRARQIDLPRFYEQPIVVVDSLGGNIEEAMAIGRMLRQWRAHVIVAPGATCASACVLILASGVVRSVYEPPMGRIGVHAMSPADDAFGGLPPEKAAQAYDRVKKLVNEYLRQMGIPESLYNLMYSIPSYDVRWLSRDEITDYGLRSSDPAYKEWIYANEKRHYGDLWFSQRAAMLKCLNAGGEEARCKELSGWR